MVTIIFFVFGLIIGSFLNVVVYRIREADTLLGRSYCPKCKKGIAWYDNIPVLSFILLNFRCRHCQKKISWQYPLVELATALIFSVVSINFFSVYDATTWLEAAYSLFVASVLMVIFVYDFLFFEIPGIVLWPAIFLAAGYNLIYDWAYNQGDIIVSQSASYQGNAAAIGAFLFFFLLVSYSKEKWMGMGDAYLAILLGLILGWPEIILGLFLAFIFGSLYGIALILLKKADLKSQVPFAPFLISGAMVSLFFYQPIIEWYFGKLII